MSLTPKEFDLLVFLASNKGIALSREKILQKVWNYDYFGEDRTVDTHVKMLRGHLGKCRGYIATAVSYTHLDVYKRQLQHRPHRLRQPRRLGRAECFRPALRLSLIHILWQRRTSTSVIPALTGWPNCWTNRSS